MKKPVKNKSDKRLKEKVKNHEKREDSLYKKLERENKQFKKRIK